MDISNEICSKMTSENVIRLDLSLSKDLIDMFLYSFGAAVSVYLTCAFGSEICKRYKRLSKDT